MSDDTIEGVQSPINRSQDEKIRFDFNDQSGKLVRSRSAEAVGHKWFRYSTGLPTGYYKIKIVNVIWSSVLDLWRASLLGMKVRIKKVHPEWIQDGDAVDKSSGLSAVFVI
jgi:hypothetical protein